MFREIKDQFNKFRNLRSISLDLEALEKEMTDDEVKYCIELLKEQHYNKLKNFREKVLIEIIKRRQPKKKGK